MAVILGIPFSNKTMKETIDTLNTHIDKVETSLHVVSANPKTVMNAKKDRRYRMIVKNADLVIADGIGIVLGSKILNQDVKERMSGYDMIHTLLKTREEQNKKTRVFMIGNTDEIVSLAAKRTKEMFSHIEIVGYHHGNFEPNSDVEKELVAQIKKTKPDLVMVDLGCPNQEEFISSCREETKGKVFISCSGCLHTLSGLDEQIPEAFQKPFLEWVWKLSKQSKKLKHQLYTPRFLIEVVKEKRKK